MDTISGLLCWAQALTKTILIAQIVRYVRFNWTVVVAVVMEETGWPRVSQPSYQFILVLHSYRLHNTARDHSVTHRILISRGIYS